VYSNYTNQRQQFSNKITWQEWKQWQVSVMSDFKADEPGFSHLPFPALSLALQNQSGKPANKQLINSQGISKMNSITASKKPLQLSSRIRLCLL
jgi:hypothetical protein